MQQQVLSRNTPESRQIQRALVVRLGGLGDILLATPTLRALAQAYPGIRIDFVLGKGLTDVLAGLPYIDKIIEFDKDGNDAHPQQFLSFMRRVRQARYDLFVNLHPSAKTMLIGKATRAGVRIGFSKDRSRQLETGRVRHAIDDFYKELSAIGISGTLDRAMDFVVPRSAADHVEKLLAEAGVGADERFVVVNPAATRLVNRWPVERFAGVCDFLVAEQNGRVAITGGPKDRATVDALKAHARSADRLIDFCGALNLKELGALLMRADAFLTCDTGPLHIAAALDTPLVCLSGAADPDRTGPLSPRSVVLIDRQLPCVPCQSKRCRFGTDIRCMAGLSVAAVTDALVKHLEMRPAHRTLLTVN